MGSAPNTDMMIQLRATETKPSLVYSIISSGFLCPRIIPHTRLRIAAPRKYKPDDSPYIKPTTAGSSKKTASNLRTEPSIYNIIR